MAVIILQENNHNLMLRGLKNWKNRGSRYYVLLMKK